MSAVNSRDAIVRHAVWLHHVARVRLLVLVATSIRTLVAQAVQDLYRFSIASRLFFF